MVRSPSRDVIYRIYLPGEEPPTFVSRAKTYFSPIYQNGHQPMYDWHRFTWLVAATMRTHTACVL